MNTINELLERYARDHDNNDVEEIIAYIRKTLASYDAGIKPKKEAGSFDMTQILSNITKTKAPPKTTSTKNIRRM